ncbi:MAG: hypothetical protein MZU95_11015 [Desulfomicrobium escambiense]|nr:hypothetical protein [Desulfomicrobium escambiense]
MGLKPAVGSSRTRPTPEEVAHHEKATRPVAADGGRTFLLYAFTGGGDQPETRKAAGAHRQPHGRTLRQEKERSTARGWWCPGSRSGSCPARRGEAGEPHRNRQEPATPTSTRRASR